MPSDSAPLAYSASRSDVALRIEDLMRGAAALRTQGSFSKAMELYNEALTIAPKYAEGYRQRAMTLVRLGDPVQAQTDYDRFLSLDPQAAGRMREEITLFEQSGQARLGESEAASYSYGSPVATATAAPQPAAAAVNGFAPAVYYSPQQLADTRFSLALDAFQRKDYDTAFDWAVRSNRYMSQARTRALMAQILFAQGDFSGAAAEARAAAAMGPVMDWRTLYAQYGQGGPRFDRQFHALEEFLRKNPSSADAHFLLGYQQLILGQTEQAHAQLAIAAVMEPTNVVATNLLAKDGVEIVSSNRPLAKAVTPSGGVEVARRPATPGRVAEQPSNVPAPAPPAPGKVGGR
ncbi:MAG: tetratricopeptide repeat protein [Planctomycetaceae bacterium]|nr:tetratricopeptide repeat protein [Planctomycetaceae bacterium]